VVRTVAALPVLYGLLRRGSTRDGVGLPREDSYTLGPRRDRIARQRLIDQPKNSVVAHAIVLARIVAAVTEPARASSAETRLV
jgi:hypothetical protein